MPESDYQRKRRFDETPEPPAEVAGGDVDPLSAPTGERFVIHQHYATNLHHDVRLEMLNGETPVLVSWAVPKGLPREKGVRALAIRTEDHPMAYATFTGSIPEGYGAGEVRIFDSGTYEMVARSDDRITVRLEGNRQPGVFHLIKTGTDNGKEQWLALLSEDHRTAREQAPKPRPMLATLAEDPFDDPAWGFEPKWDGVRSIAVCDTATRLVSRNGKDMAPAYPELARVHDRLVALEAMLDGEVVAFAEGRPSFQRLQQRMHVRDRTSVERLARTTPVVLMVFDLLYLDGEDLTSLPLTQRRRRMEEVLVPSEAVQLSPIIAESGTALFRAASEQGLEGVIAKKLTSSYEPGARSRSWLKMKVTFEADVVVAGWTEGEGRREGKLGSLVMGMFEEGRLRHVGNVGTGFDERSLADARDRLRSLATDQAPFSPEATRSRPELRKAHWVEPRLVAVVEHRQVTDAGRLRAPAFKGFRDDKDPELCTFDQLVAGAPSPEGES